MDFGIRGKSAVVTGSSKGIGYDVTKLLLQEGVKVGTHKLFAVSNKNIGRYRC